MTQQTRKGFVQRTLSVLSATALALTGVLVMGGTAASASPGDIVAPEGGGSIILHKHSGTPGAAGNGQLIQNTEANPGAVAALGSAVAGVPFKLERVALSATGTPIDLSDPAAWNNLPANPAAAAVAPFSLVTEVASTNTDTSGMITFGGLDLGLYLVTELPGGPGVDTVAAPFLVSVPHRAATDSTWNYNVHVYPKNRLADTPTKVVSDPTGNNVTWTITTKVPRTTVGLTFTTDMRITDQLDSRLTYVSATVKKNNAVMTPTPTLVVVTGQLVTVNIPQATLVTGDVYVVEIVTTVTGPGVIPNTAVRHLDGVDVNIGPAQTNWGNVSVLKHETGNTAVTLAGAVFELYTYDANVANRTLVRAAQTTGPSGVTTFENLWLGNSTVTTKQFCLKETQAPAGHSIANVWTCVTLNAANTGIVQQLIDNPPRTTPNLPLTGSAGTAAFMAGGLGLLLTAAGIAIVATRRNTRSKTL